MKLSETIEKSSKNSVSETLKAAVFTGPKTIETKEFKLPQPKTEEVRIKLEGCGVCASNIPVWEGRKWFNYPQEPGSPGHEGWGVIDAIGADVLDWKIGDRVTFISGNAYASHDIAKTDDLVLIPPSFGGHAFPGEPLGCAYNIFERSDIRVGQTVAIVGVGFLGALLIQLAKAAGATVIAISRRDFSLKVAKENGADEVIKMDDHYKIIESVKKLTHEKFSDRVIEATGKEWPLNLSIELTAIRGKLIVAGYHQDGMRSVNVQMLNWRGIDMISAHERDSKNYINGIKMAIKAIENKEMDPFPLFTNYFTLNEMSDAFYCLTERPDGFVKALIINE